MKRPLCPAAVAEACLEDAWLDSLDDHVRLHLEQAHDVIQNLMARCIATSKVLETVEAELASRRWPLLNDDDDEAAA